MTMNVNDINIECTRVDADKLATVIERMQLRPLSLDPGTP
jgi:hypothetical protein